MELVPRLHDSHHQVRVGGWEGREVGDDNAPPNCDGKRETLPLRMRGSPGERLIEGKTS